MASNNTLFIFDETIDLETVFLRSSGDRSLAFHCFSLSGDISLSHRVAKFCRQRRSDSFFINSAGLIEEEINRLRGNITRWSMETGDCRIGNKTIKEWFFLRKYGVSTWWFSLFSEKNPLKTDAFLKIAQIYAIKKCLEERKYSSITITVSDRDLRDSIRQVACQFSVPAQVLPSRPPCGINARMKAILKKAGILGELARGGYYLFRILKRKYLVSKYLPTTAGRQPVDDALLFITYFPYLEKDSAQTGIFRNRYAVDLQDKLAEANIPVVWVGMYVPIDGIDYEEGLKLAKRFIGKGEKFFILEEFLTIRDFFAGTLLWIQQVLVSSILYPFAKKAILSPYIGRECLPVIKSLWNASFSGSAGIGGILYLLAFKRLFRELPCVKDCLYYSEMHAWEHALNAAKNKEKTSIKTIGFQHTSIPRNWFSYFWDKKETSRTGKPTELPLPDIMACNGELMYKILSESGYPGLTQVEALRHLYLNKTLSSPVAADSKKSMLLVAGSIDKKESLRLVEFIALSFSRPGDFDICFKGHPTMPFERLFEELGIDFIQAGYKISHKDISELLEEAQIVLVPSSTVVVEAMAYGCEVIIPVFPDSFLINPLVGFEEFYHRITCPEDLAEVIKKIRAGHKLHSLTEYRKFVRQYWDVDPSLPKWLELLSKDFSYARG